MRYPNPTRARVLAHFQEWPGRVLYVSELIEAAYADDPSGGPLDAGAVIRATIYSLRRDHDIRTYDRRGYVYEQMSSLLIAGIEAKRFVSRRRDSHS